jgi:hypothetical protein
VRANLDRNRAEIIAHESNAWGPRSRLRADLLRGAGCPDRARRAGARPEGPGVRRAVERCQWCHAARPARVDDEQFYDPNLFAIIPMDFYYPGKAASGDLPSRKDFADRWHERILGELPGLVLTILVGAYAQRYYLGIG